MKKMAKSGLRHSLFIRSLMIQMKLECSSLFLRQGTVLSLRISTLKLNTVPCRKNNEEHSSFIWIIRDRIKRECRRPDFAIFFIGFIQNNMCAFHCPKHRSLALRRCSVNLIGKKDITEKWSP